MKKQGQRWYREGDDQVRFYALCGVLVGLTPEARVNMESWPDFKSFGSKSFPCHAWNPSPKVFVGGKPSKNIYGVLACLTLLEIISSIETLLVSKGFFFWKCFRYHVEINTVFFFKRSLLICYNISLKVGWKWKWSIVLERWNEHLTAMERSISMSMSMSVKLI